MTCPWCQHPVGDHGEHGCQADDVWSGRCPCALSVAAVAEAVATWGTHTPTGRRVA